MSRNILMGLLMILSNKVFAGEVLELPITVSGRVISREESVIKKIEKGLYEIKIYNNLGEDIYILGKGNMRPFIWKVKNEETRICKVEAEKIKELSYVLNGKKYSLNKYSDLKKEN